MKNYIFRRICDLLRDVCGEADLKITSRLWHDIRLYGDDAEEFLDKFRHEFHVNFDDFNWETFFYNESR